MISPELKIMCDQGAEVVKSKFRNYTQFACRESEQAALEEYMTTNHPGVNYFLTITEE